MTLLTTRRRHPITQHPWKSSSCCTDKISGNQLQGKKMYSWHIVSKVFILHHLVVSRSWVSCWGSQRKKGDGDKIQSSGHVLKDPVLSTRLHLLITHQSVDEVKSSWDQPLEVSSLNRAALGTTPLTHGPLLVHLDQSHDLTPVCKVASFRLHSFA